jgi:hypothetical protein
VIPPEIGVGEVCDFLWSGISKILYLKHNLLIAIIRNGTINNVTKNN